MPDGLGIPATGFCCRGAVQAAQRFNAWCGCYLIPDLRGASRPGGCGHLPDPRPRLAAGAMRSPGSGATQVMLAIEQCRSTALGGHVLYCPAGDQTEIAYNACCNRHCQKCQASAARRWLETRQADWLPIAYYHVVFTLPAPISGIAYSNKALIYRLLFEVAAETLRTITADPRHLGAQIGVTLVIAVHRPRQASNPHRFVARQPPLLTRGAPTHVCHRCTFFHLAFLSILPPFCDRFTHIGLINS